MRKCPRCKVDLKQKEYKKVMVDECPKCGGIWFDRDELRKAKDNTSDNLRWLDYEPFTSNNSTANTNLVCPACKHLLNETTYDKSKVKINPCLNCKGTWLDKNEIDKILNYLQDLIVTKTSKEYAKATIEELKEIITGPESKLSEFKDLVAVANLLELRYAVEHPWITNLYSAIYQLWPIK